MRRSNPLFCSKELVDLFRTREQDIENTVARYSLDYIMQVSGTDLLSYLVSKYSLEAPVLHKESADVMSSDGKFDVSSDPTRFIRDRSRPCYVNGTTVSVRIPFEGDRDLFDYAASTRSYNPPQARIEANYLVIDIELIEQGEEYLRKEYEIAFSNIEKHLNWLQQDVQQFNRRLPSVVEKVIEKRKSKLLKDQGLVASLGLPLRKRQSEVLTFNPPEIKRKMRVQPPAIPEGKFEPEPALQDEEYDYILSVIDRLAITMETSPDTFSKFKEEELRDILLVMLNGHYEGDATGETFNSSGKTDILIKNKGKTVFIAECKFWTGPQGFIKAIDQLLSYVSWRDSKTAIIIFNKNKNFSSVLESIRQSVPTHPNFKRELKHRGPSHFRYLFHQNGDPNREIYVAVIAFDIPGKGT